MLWPCSSEIDDGLSLAGQYAGRGGRGVVRCAQVPDNFRFVVQATLREFYVSIAGEKDVEQSWKKSIYKVIARMDDAIPEYFKSPNWMQQLLDA